MKVIRETVETRRMWYEMDITPEYLAHMQFHIDRWTKGLAPTITEEMVIAAVEDKDLPDHDLDVFFNFSCGFEIVKTLREAIYDFIMDDLWEFESECEILDTDIIRTEVESDAL